MLFDINNVFKIHTKYLNQIEDLKQLNCLSSSFFDSINLEEKLRLFRFDRCYAGNISFCDICCRLIGQFGKLL